MESFFYKGSSFLRQRKIAVFLCLISVAMYAQQKSNSNNLPGYPELIGTSAGGRFTGFFMRYAQSDTLCVYDNRKRTTHKFGNVSYGRFWGTGHLVLKTTKGVETVNLISQKQALYEKGVAFELTGVKKRLIVVSHEPKGSYTLESVDEDGNSFKKVEEVTEYKMSPDQRSVAFSTLDSKGYSIGCLNVSNNNVQWIVQHKTLPFRQISWDSLGTALACIQTEGSGNNTVVYYNFTKNRLYRFTAGDFPISGIDIITDEAFKISVDSNNGNVFFAYRLRGEVKSETQKPEIWNTGDKQVFAQAKNSGNDQGICLGMWNPVTGISKTVTSSGLPSVYFTPDYHYALTYNPLAYEPQFNFTGPTDIYLTDLKTNQKKLLLKEHSSNLKHTLPSPGGKYILYFKNHDWFAYQLPDGTVVNLTRNLKVQFDDELHDMPEENTAYGTAGWTENDKTVLLYDRYDIWEMDPMTQRATRLTKGREQKTALRIVYPEGTAQYKRYYSGWTGTTLVLEKGLLLQATGDDGKTGYFKWTGNKGTKEIVYRDKKIDQLHYCGPDGFVYREQDFGTVPHLVYQKEEKQKAIIPADSLYSLGSSVKINYKDPVGNLLNGYICLPPNYDPSKKYPMIVHIYQRQFRDFHLYYPPSTTNPNGFNVTNFTLSGYVVLFPDIHYQQGAPGKSALDCVLAATQKAIAMGIADPEKIGLIGHSFGGYETNFIITHSSLFRAAVSGAAVSDLESYYTTINWTNGRPDMWRMEYQQYRFGASLFENPKAYRENSPVVFANNITTPLLMWSGKEDHQVDWHQSIAFHLALRRLGKNSILLLYQGEGHNLLQDENQADLTLKIQQWFDCYLMDTPAQAWMDKK